MKTPEQIKYSNKMRDDIIRILEDCPDMAAVYPLLHYMESEIKQVEDFWENAHAHTECKLKDEIAALTNKHLKLRDQEEDSGIHSNYTDPEAGRESGWSV